MQQEILGDNMVTAVEALTEAREKIKRGWIQGREKQKTGVIFHHYSYCAIGALHDGPYVSGALTALGAALPEDWVTWRGPAKRVTLYNDKHYRTQEEILALYDRAIELAKLDEAAKEQS